MPWRVTSPMYQRQRFVLDAEHTPAAFAELCRRYGISRKTGYKWLGRYRCDGAAGLRERSHAPLRHGQAHDVAVVQAVVNLRARWGWGPKKLRVKLGALHPKLPVPAASTIGDWLRTRGRSVAAAGALSGLRAAFCRGGGGQRRVVHRFQEPAPGPNRGLVPHRRRPAVRSVHPE